jgi:hypothetical protein
LVFPGEEAAPLRLAIVSLVVAVAVTALAAPVSADTNIVVVAGFGKLASGASVAVAAASTPFGVHGQLRVESAPGSLFVSEVTCLKVDGARVLIGGVIVRSPSPATLGQTSLVAVEEGAVAQPDLVGFAFSNSGLDTCPIIPLPMNPVSVGRFVVAD